ncbi:integrator complex subunit 9-like [Stylonychia lemnae]|uniref:Integrator complex subunit 9-like n=1 Tax=Stylonychia lemnae TaxID=5949 RepID=A0A078ADK7_STYLE|nr:integrator complex subunit 9-like [Stylonychia lemnae]|eukprot:CDW78963.1 integrator complex subunit 9-like [Stylonychia lemnae]
MKITNLSQSTQDGDLFLIQVQKVTILYGSTLKLSSILNYLPAHFNFPEDDELDGLASNSDRNSPKSQKRQKLQDKEEQFAQLLQPLNINDCDFESFPNPDILQPQKPFTKLKYTSQSNATDGLQANTNNKLYKKLDGRYFIDNESIKFELRKLNIVQLSDIDIILVCNFNDIYGLPFITRLQSQFMGKIYMTLPMGQIGQQLLKEFVIQNDNRNLTKDLGSKDSSYFKHEKLRELFKRQGIDEWQDLYTYADIERCFTDYVKLLNYNESFTFDNLIKMTPLSSGLHLGSCNWLLEIGQHRVGILSNSSEEGDFRYPLYFNVEDLFKNLDVLIVGSILKQQNDQLFFWQQSKLFYEKLNNCLNSSLNAKVLLPVQPTFILEIIDILIHKLTNVRIIFISESADQIMQYANISVEYLNQKLQTKIQGSENPFQFEKLLNDDRMQVFSNIEQYLEHKKEKQLMNGGIGSFDEFSKEIIITSHPSMRLGESSYWLNHLNKNNQSQSFMILTDSQFCHDELLMKPFAKANNVKVLYSPIDPNLTFTQLNNILNKFKPKRLICPASYTREQKSVGIDQANFKNALIIQDLEGTVVNTIKESMTVCLTDDDIGTLKYKGLCPTLIANKIKIKNKNQQKISRVQGIDIEFKDNQYTIVDVVSGQDQTEQKQALSLYSKLLELNQSKQSDQRQNSGQIQQSKISNNTRLIKVNSLIPLDKSLNQLRVTLQQSGFKNHLEELEDLGIIKLEEYDCQISVDYRERCISVECQNDFQVMIKVNDTIKKTLKLI